MKLRALLASETLAGLGATIAAAQAAPEAAPVVGVGVAATAAGLGGTWFVRYVLGRFDRLDASLGETREDVAAIMGALNVERPRPRARQ